MKLQNTTRWLLLLLSTACASEEASTNVTPSGSGDATHVPAGANAGAAGAPSGAGPTHSMTAAPTSGASPSSSGTSKPGDSTPAADPGAGAPAANGGSAPAAPLAECEGFKLEGLMYSPGGDTLPNTCEPFHPTTNNPYAVRCVDAWPWYKTEFPGDDFCILPPPPDLGVQYGVHPQGKQWFEQVSQGDMSGYQNLGDEWTMNDGEEEQANYETSAVTMEDRNFYRSYARMRAGSHHMIVNSDPSKPGNETWIPVSPGGLLDAASGLSLLGLPGAQRPDENRPPSLAKPMEDAGLYRTLPAGAPITFNMHHFNAQGKVIMKEAWTNLWFENDARVQVHGLRGLEVGQVLTMAIPPGATQDFHYSWNISQPVRLVEAFGHRHAWTTNFSAWVENSDGATDILYQSFQWLDEPTYRYDTVTQNPTPAPDNRADGASSGIRMLMPGQKLHFNCHIEFTPERAATEGAPDPSEIGTLGFANEAFTGEMCILFGSTAAVEMPAPVADGSPLPGFATID
jgi:hypothetical protein